LHNKKKVAGSKMKTNSGLGEREIIKIIQSHLDSMPRMPIQFGDDVSAYDLGNGKLAVLKTDMLVGLTDVPPGMSLWQAARKAVVMNISDFAAKGVKPLTLLVSLGLPANISREEVKEIGKGLNAGAREYGAYVIGGDTGESTDLIISISLFGLAEKANLVLRSGAQPNDIVAVTGSFGKTAAGLRILLKKAKSPEALRKSLIESVLMPHARLEEGLALSLSQTASASIDSSDGLAWSLHEIARASKVGFLIDKLPVAEEAIRFATLNRLDASDLALYGGEEYEVVVTVKSKFWKKAEKAVEDAGGKLIRIGKVTKERQVLLKTEGKARAIEPHGYEHFKTSEQ
jgi:thiamine-monophosphate kinase